MSSRDDALEAAYPLGPALDFLRVVGRLNQAIEQRSSRMEQRLGVTAQQRLILRCLGKYPGLTAGLLSHLLCLDPGTVSASLRRLSQRHLLERRSDPRDHRRTTLGLTARGRALDRATEDSIESAVERLLHASSERELKSAARVLGRLAALLTAEPANGAARRVQTTRQTSARSR